MNQIQSDERNSRRALEKEAESNRVLLAKVVAELQKERNEVSSLRRSMSDHIMIPINGIPKGAKFVESYITPKNVLVVLGDPINTAHNCDEMGCSTVHHVMFRIDINALTNAEVKL